MEGASSHVGAGGSGGPGARRGDGDGDGDAHTRPLAVIEQQQHKDEDVVFDAALVAGWELEQSALPAAPAAAGAAAAGADAGASAAVKTEAAALPLPAAVAQEAPSLEEEMTLIVTTSVAPLNPLTEFIQDVVASYALHEPSLLRCRKIIVCDWPQVRKGPSKFRVGKVNADALAKYEEYVAALRALAAQGAAEASHPFHRAEVMVLGERQGFALAVGHALRATSTPFVMVVQHDRRLTRPFGLPAVMAAFRSFAFRNVNYLCLSTSSSGKNPELEMERSAVEVRDHVLYVPGTDVRAVPMSFWLDSTHIARADFYRDFTLESHCINQWKWCTLKAGDFIEDKFGNLIRSRCREFGKRELDRVGTYLMVIRGDDALAYQYWQGGKRERAFYDENEDFKKHEGVDRWNFVLVRHLNQRKARSILTMYGHEYDRSYYPEHEV